MRIFEFCTKRVASLASSFKATDNSNTHAESLGQISMKFEGIFSGMAKIAETFPFRATHPEN